MLRLRYKDLRPPLTKLEEILTREPAPQKQKKKKGKHKFNFYKGYPKIKIPARTVPVPDKQFEMKVNYVPVRKIGRKKKGQKIGSQKNLPPVIQDYKNQQKREVEKRRSADRISFAPDILKSKSQGI